MNILITDMEHWEYMTLLKDKICTLGGAYKGLTEDLKRIEQPNRLDLYKGSLTVAEIKELQASIKDRQHELFKKWYALNQQRQDLGMDYIGNISDLGGHLVGVTRYSEVIK